MIDGIPVVDAVVHSYDFSPANWASDMGQWIAVVAYGGSAASNTPAVEARFPGQEGYLRDWSMEETANQLFVESDVDVAVHHALPLFHAFKDGGCSFEKTLEAKERWPGRFITYAGVDPIQGAAALEMLEQQVEALDPVGVKLYPDGWVGNELRSWTMDDPEIAYPIFERAQALGLKVVAVHKAVPLGPVPIAPYRVDDIDRAARDFPELAFEIVHGGMAFLEETAWQLARFPNVYANLEITTSLLGKRPRAFARAIATMLQYAGPMAADKILWGTGCMGFHPQQYIERFVRDFEFDEATLELANIPQLTLDIKRKILSGNYARMIGLDLEARLAELENDEFAQRRDANGGLFEPYSTTTFAANAV
jgi:predicted TIM-barrel fold metal-dependent hydrolase